jgi:hypothetical protein
MRIALIIVMFTASVASGQATRPANAPATRPAQRSAEEMLRQMLQPANQGAQPLKPIPEVAPQTDATSGAAAVAPAAPQQRLEHEGTLLLDRIGRLTRGRDTKWLEFRFESDGRSMTDPPLLLLPNRQLMQLEELVNHSQADLAIRVISGEITEYRGRNYLMINRWSQVADVAQPLR